MFQFIKISSLSGDQSNWRTEPSTTIPPTVALNTINDTQSSVNGIPQATEVNPSLYDQLKLGDKGAGFKRLVS